MKKYDSLTIYFTKSGGLSMTFKSIFKKYSVRFKLSEYIYTFGLWGGGGG